MRGSKGCADIKRYLQKHKQGEGAQYIFLIPEQPPTVTFCLWRAEIEIPLHFLWSSKLGELINCGKGTSRMSVRRVIDCLVVRLQLQFRMPRRSEKGNDCVLAYAFAFVLWRLINRRKAFTGKAKSRLDNNPK